MGGLSQTLHLWLQDQILVLVTLGEVGSSVFLTEKEANEICFLWILWGNCQASEIVRSLLKWASYQKECLHLCFLKCFPASLLTPALPVFSCHVLPVIMHCPSWTPSCTYICLLFSGVFIVNCLHNPGAYINFSLNVFHFPLRPLAPLIRLIWYFFIILKFAWLLLNPLIFPPRLVVPVS